MHPHILFAHSSCKWTTKTYPAPPIFTKLHPSYHLNSTQPDTAMWQSPPFKSGQPYADTCHNPPLTKMTNQTLPRHHLLYLTHETLTLIFLLSYHHHGSRRPPFTDLAVNKSTTTAPEPRQQLPQIVTANTATRFHEHPFEQIHVAPAPFTDLAMHCVLCSRTSDNHGHRRSATSAPPRRE